jgi:hypothetical protein
MPLLPRSQPKTANGGGRSRDRVKIAEQFEIPLHSVEAILAWIKTHRACSANP